MPIVSLPHRASILVTGHEAEDFLQNILTLDLQTLQLGEARPGALLTPQGKILFDFLISRTDAGFRLDCRMNIASDFARRLLMYRLRAKVDIAVQDESLVAVSWGEESGSSFLFDRRFGDGDVRRSYDAEMAAPAALEAWTALRVSRGVAESGSDYELSDAFPHDVLLDQNGGVGFKKGCYVGQEVVSRMQHRGTARRRMLIALGDAPLPPPGTPITAEGRLIGSMGSAAGQQGLALVRIDKVADAVTRGVPILADDVSLRLSIPSWARFDFPSAAASED
jgi:folate-binding protein YgfZ